MITGFYAGILALLYAVLSFTVIKTRIRDGIRFGDDGQDRMVRIVRTHGNFAEYAPFTVLLMAFYEMQAGSLYVLHAMGITLVVSRLLHAVGLRRDILAARAGGTVLTLLLLVILGVTLIYKGFILMTIV